MAAVLRWHVCPCSQPATCHRQQPCVLAMISEKHMSLLSPTRQDICCSTAGLFHQNGQKTDPDQMTEYVEHLVAIRFRVCQITVVRPDSHPHSAGRPLLNSINEMEEKEKGGGGRKGGKMLSNNTVGVIHKYQTGTLTKTSLSLLLIHPYILSPEGVRNHSGRM